MRIRHTAGLLTAMVLATGALNIGCGSESEKPHEGTTASQAKHATDEVPVTGAGGSTRGVGAGVGTGGGTGAGSGQTSFDATVDATSDSAKAGATTTPSSEAAKPAADGHGSGHDTKGEHK